MDRLKMPFDEEALVAEVGTRIRPIEEGQDQTLVQKEYSTDAHTQQMLKIDEKIRSELGVSEEQLKEGLDLGVREPLSAKEQEDIKN